MILNEEWHELNVGELPKLLTDKLEPFGFDRDGDAYFYAEDLLAGSFKLHVKVSKNGLALGCKFETFHIS